MTKNLPAKIQYPEKVKENKILALDIETYDPNLRKMGNGVYRRDGHILGVSLATPDGFAEYYDVGHPGVKAATVKRNWAFLKDVLVSDVPKLGANLMYDLDWLENFQGLKVNGKIHDILTAEPLLEESKRQYNLDALALQYLGHGKVKTKIEEFCEANNLKGDPRQHLHLMKYEDVRDYAIGDVFEPLLIFRKQWVELKKQGLLPLYEMETDIIRVALQMRKTGVRIDAEQVEKGIRKLTRVINKNAKLLYSEYGDVNFRSTVQLAKHFKRDGVPMAYTEKGNPSIKDAVLEAVRADYPLAEYVWQLRKATKVRDDFLISSFTEHAVDGRIHADFNPLRSDDYGTVSGRWSMSNPNLQQIPNPKKLYGDVCRACFIPEEGMLWGKTDYSQVEYRVIAHYAVGPRSELVREKYTNDPNTDYHQMIMDWTGLTRDQAKRLNFGAAYAMGAKRCAEQFGWTFEESQALLNRYHAEVPFVKATRNNVVNVARRRGYIRTHLNRRARVTPQMKRLKKEYSLFNRLIQGTAADIMKKAMLDSYNAGVFEILPLHLTVHDELDQSIPQTKEGVEAYAELKYIMENTVSLKVPVVADAEIGKNWYAVKEIDDWQKLTKRLTA